ncbi:MAG: hypothetical protein MUP76_02705, partial [Acidimicrobiia bacterium]|nr:hypothetical protein [Acidimicrobiia bacterium]
VAVRMVSQAASRRNLTIVLRDADLPSAMARLHDRFFAHARAAGPSPGAVGLSTGNTARAHEVST